MPGKPPETVHLLFSAVIAALLFCLAPSASGAEQSAGRRIFSFDLGYLGTGLKNNGWGLGVSYEAALLSRLAVKGGFSHMTMMPKDSGMTVTTVGIQLEALCYPFGRGLDWLYVGAGCGTDFLMYKGDGLSEIACGVNTDFNFNLPAAVIRKTLIRMKGISHHNDEKYSVDYSLLANIDLSEIKNSSEAINGVLFSLIAYVENKTDKNLSEQEKENLNNDFLKYVMHSSCSEINMKYISIFILENENDSSIVEIINAIKEGAIIYIGITTDLKIDDNNIDNLGIWKKEITIFLDMEILFHLYGYNGEYYKQQADDFISLVKEINRTKRFVHLKYFTKVKEEIYAFFKAAENVVSKGFLNENTVAMSAIVRGCSSPSDVVEKKALFFNFLKQYSIEEDANDSYYTDENNFKYNIENAEEEIHPDLNFINILRKGRNSGKLIDIGYILLTGKSSILKQSWEKRNNKDIPRASNLDYITEHFGSY